MSEAATSSVRQLAIDWERGAVGLSADSVTLLRPQSMAVLKVLYENAGKVVTKEQLLTSVWPDVAVTDDSLVQCITEIRKAIEDAGRTIIKTLPKRGYIFQPSIIDIKSKPFETLHSKNKTWGFAGAAAMVVALFVLVLILRPAPKPVELPAIAVLPFKNLGSDPKGDKFADMMTEDVITDLSHSKDFAVIARSSTEIYKGKSVDIPALGRNLNVKYVLEAASKSFQAAFAPRRS